MAGSWGEQRAGWALPDEVVAAAPRDPWGHDVTQFADRARRAAGRDLPADRIARAALPRLGTVLDVGCGAGAAVVALGARGRWVIGVDRSPAMLAAFRQATRRWWRRIDTVAGSWPHVEVPVADVVVCHDVVYDVPDLGSFVAALSAHARRRVVVVLPARHPMTWLAPYFEALHGLARPQGPTATDAVEEIRATGVEPQVTCYRDLTRWGTAGAATEGDLVASVRWRLGLPPERDEDIRRVVRGVPPPSQREVVAVWWEP